MSLWRLCVDCKHHKLDVNPWTSAPHQCHHPNNFQWSLVDKYKKRTGPINCENHRSYPARPPYECGDNGTWFEEKDQVAE